MNSLLIIIVLYILNQTKLKSGLILEFQTSHSFKFRLQITHQLLFVLALGYFYSSEVGLLVFFIKHYLHFLTKLGLLHLYLSHHFLLIFFIRVFVVESWFLSLFNYWLAWYHLLSRNWSISCITLASQFELLLLQFLQRD
jgi:hypothetical protein